MTKLNQIGLGLRTYGQAVGFIFKNNMAWTLLVPIALNVLLFIGGQTLTENLITDLKQLVLGWINLDGSGFWGGLLGGVLAVLSEVIFFLIFAYISGYVVIILMSPLLAYLSEKTEKILTGKEYHAGLLQLISDIIRGITIALRNLFMELLFLVLMFFVGLIPVIGWLGPVVLFFISAYFYGFSFIDYNNERQKLSIKESVTVVRKYKWLAIANGSIFSITLFIPFCGAFVSLFMAIISVVAATMAMHQTSAYSNDID